MVTAADETQPLKLETKWSKEKDNESHGNSRALNVIFNCIDKKCLPSYQHVY